MLLEKLPRHNMARSSREEELAGHRAWLAGDDVRALCLRQVDQYSDTPIAS